MTFPERVRSKARSGRRAKGSGPGSRAGCGVKVRPSGLWEPGLSKAKGRRLSQKLSASGAGGFGTQLLNPETNFTGKLGRAPGSFWCQNTAGKLLDSHSL